MMFCPENSEHALSLRVRQESAAPCRIRLSGRKEARPSPAAEMSGGRFFVSILKMNFIVNIRTDLFLPPPLLRRRYGARHRAFYLCKSNMRGSAAPPGPKRAEKHAFPRNDRPYGWKDEAFQTKHALYEKRAMPPGIIACARRLCGMEGALPKKSLPRLLSAQCSACSSRATNLRDGQSGFSRMASPPFLRRKKPRRSIRRRETPERTLSAVPEDVQSCRTKAQCFRLYNTSTFYDKKSGLSFTKNIRKAGKRLQKKCRRKP